MNDRLRFCLAGRGSIGTRHLKNLKNLLDADVIAYSERVDQEKDSAFYKDYGVETCHNVKDLEAFSPHAFIVANATSDHVRIAGMAVEMGSHIFMEKPFSNTLTGVDELRDRILEKKLVFCLANNFRFHPLFKKIKSLMEGKAFGKIYFARIMAGQYLPDWHPWEDYRQSYSARKELGGGAVLTLQHEIDYAYWLFGGFSGIKSHVKKISNLEMDVEDVASIVAEAETGQLIEIHVDYLQRPPARTIHIQGEKGSIDFRFGDRELRFYHFDQKEYETVLDLHGYDANRMYMDELDNFINCIRKKELPVSGIDDAIYVLNKCLEIKKGFIL